MFEGIHIRGSVSGAACLVAVATCLVQGDNAPPTTEAPALLLTDRHGAVISGSTNDPAGSESQLSRQIPPPPKGAPQADAVRQRIAESKSGRKWFPSTPPVLLPYLANLDEYGNTALQPGALITITPISNAAQAIKESLSDVGLRYTFYQSVTVASISGPASGASALQYYTATYLGKWAVAEDPALGSAAWLSTEFNAQFGFSPASRSQSLQGNIGSVVNPNATIFGPDGLWISELAWQQSLMNGRLVVLAGQLDQSNYLDSNLYANNSQGQFLNSAFVNSQVLPLTYNNLGVNLQYQLADAWYSMLGIGSNTQEAGQSPFTDLGFSGVSYLLEVGWMPSNFLGIGPGAYRIQPFLATVNGVTQAGVGLNFQQRLGSQSPLGWFGRFGVGGDAVTLDGATVQIGSGLAVQAPLQYAGLCPGLTNDYAGAGFVWSRPSQVSSISGHSDEYGLECVYVLQLTPQLTVQPDLQVIWNPAGAPEVSRNIIFQLQANLTL